MDKPASMVMNEFTEKLEDCINKSGLPPVILELILGRYYTQIRSMAERQTLQETNTFTKSKEDDDNGK